MRRFALAIAATLGLALLMCSARGAGAQSSNMIRLIQASPDAPALDVFINGEVVAGGMRFFSVSDYITLADGTYQVAIGPAGRGTDYALLVGDLDVGGGYVGSLAIFNTFANMRATLYADDLSAPPVGQAQVRLLQLAPDVPALDIGEAEGGATLFRGVAFGQSARARIPADTYALVVSAVDSGERIFGAPYLRFEAGWVYTLATTGERDKGGFWLQTRVDSIPAPLRAEGLARPGFGRLTLSEAASR